jgi:hypothetical protein
MYTAMMGTEVMVGASSYPGLECKELPNLPIPYPSLIVNWQVPIADEVRDEMRNNGWRDTLVKGKPGMIKDRPSPSDATYALSKSCLQTTPTLFNSMNIASFRKAIFIATVAATFLRTHQYPAFIDDDHESEFAKSFR